MRLAVIRGIVIGVAIALLLPHQHSLAVALPLLVVICVALNVWVQRHMENQQRR